MRKRLWQIPLAILAILLSVVLAVVGFIDDDHYTQEAYFSENRRQFADLIWQYKKPTQRILAGWSRESIIPPFNMPMAAYRQRPQYQGVHDTLYASALIIKQPDGQKTAILSIDLLIFPYSIYSPLCDSLVALGWRPEQLFVGASHTHNGLGGWVEGWAAPYIAGDYDQEAMKFMLAACLGAIKKAEAQCLPASYTSWSFESPNYVENRVDESYIENPWAKGLAFKNSDGKTCIIGTYTAHPTNIPSNSLELGNDYPYYWRSSMEKNGDAEMAFFLAGAVGSQAPNCKQKQEKSWEKAQCLGDKLALQTQKAMHGAHWKDSAAMESARHAMALDDLQVRLGDHWGTKPWVFEHIFGEQRTYLSAFRLDSICWAGTPCDFSGELAYELYQKAQAKSIDLCITSFNGAYVGYIIPQHYYARRHSEARQMNWTGPHTGEMMSWMIENSLLPHKNE